MQYAFHLVDLTNDQDLREHFFGFSPFVVAMTSACTVIFWS